jgi:hypothetical protein
VPLARDSLSWGGAAPRAELAIDAQLRANAELASRAGQVRVAFVFAIAHGKIISIDLVMEPAQLAELDVEIA